MLLDNLYDSLPINKYPNVRLDEATYKELKSLYDEIYKYINIIFFIFSKIIIQI